MTFIWELMKDYVLPVVFLVAFGYAIVRSGIYLEQEKVGMFFTWFFIAGCNLLGLWASIERSEDT